MSIWTASGKPVELAGPPPSTALRDVLRAVSDGPGSVPEIARRAGLTVRQTQAALATLEAIGRLRAAPLAGSSCPSTGCGDCAQRSGCPVESAAGSSLLTWQVVRTR